MPDWLTTGLAVLGAAVLLKLAWDRGREPRAPRPQRVLKTRTDPQDDILAMEKIIRAHHYPDFRFREYEPDLADYSADKLRLDSVGGDVPSFRQRRDDGDEHLRR